MKTKWKLVNGDLHVTVKNRKYVIRDDEIGFDEMDIKDVRKYKDSFVILIRKKGIEV